MALDLNISLSNALYHSNTGLIRCLDLHCAFLRLHSSCSSSTASSFHTKSASSSSADAVPFASNFETCTSTKSELRSTPDFDLSPELGLTVTPELLELQMRLEASIAQQRQDEVLARRLQELEEAPSPTQERYWSN